MAHGRDDAALVVNGLGDTLQVEVAREVPHDTVAAGEVDRAKLRRIDIGDGQRVLQPGAKGRGLQLFTRRLIHVQPTEAALVQRHSTSFGAGKYRRVASRFHDLGEMRQLCQPQARGIGP